jgi:hypothetical protein
MFLSIGIEVRSGRLEIGRFALRVLMKVDGMFAGRQILEIQFDSDSRAGSQNGCGAHGLPWASWR